MCIVLMLLTQWTIKTKFGRTITKPIENIELMIITADFQNQRTGLVLNNANSLGNAEVPEHAKEVDGAMDMMDVMELSSHTKLQDFFQIAERATEINFLEKQKLINLDMERKS